MTNNKHVLEFLTDDPQIVEQSPIARATAPEWWQNLAQSFDEHGGSHATMRACRGFTSLYETAIQVHYPYEVTFTEVDGRFNFSKLPLMFHRSGQNLNPLVAHNPKQYGEQFADYWHVKFVMPWFVKGPKGHRFLMTNAFWGHQADFHTLNGIVDFHEQHSVNVNTFIRRGFGRLEFQRNMPIAQLIPLHGQADYEIINRVATSDEIAGIAERHALPRSMRG